MHVEDPHVPFLFTILKENLFNMKIKLLLLADTPS